MTSIVITIIILIAVAASFTAVQTVYQRESRVKSAVENGRVAIGYIERVTRYIGYGIDPLYAIDIGTGPLSAVGGLKSNYIGVNANNVTTTATNTGFVTDDFAFRYRDPDYLRRGTYIGGTITLDTSTGAPGTFNVPLQANRLIQVVCTGGVVWTVVRTTTATAATVPSISTVSANNATNPTSFPTPPSDPCFSVAGANAPFIMLIHEVRLRIIPLGTSPNIRPYLVAYNDLSLTNIGTTAADFDPIAADIESFQVSYMMNKDPSGVVTAADGTSGNADWILGNAASDVAIPTATGTRPTYDLGYSDPLRYTADVANVRAVVFDLAVRSLRPEQRRAFPRPQLADDTLVGGAVDGYFHVSLSTTVRTPNLASRTMFTPALKQPGDLTALNVWGG